MAQRDDREPARSRVVSGLARTGRPLNLGRWFSTCLGTAVLTATLAAAGQPAETGSAPAATPPWPAVTIEQAFAQQVSAPPDMAWRALERAVLLDLRLRPAPTPDDYRFALIGLETAARGLPDDAGLWRNAAESAFSAGDGAGLERATRQILRIDPSDTVAQLRLITTRIGRLQTGTERLAALDRLLGAGGASLDAAVRSRLALDAAVLARESGDEDGFARYLSLATTLDSSHKEAAALALAYFQTAVPDDAVGRMQLLVNLLMADPLDPHVHLAMSAELASHGAFPQSARFHNNALNVIGASDAALANTLDKRGLILMWHLDGPEKVVELLNQRLARLRHDAAFSAALRERHGQPVRENERPENTRLSRELDLIRMMAADAAGLREVVADASRDLTNSALEVIAFYERPENQPTGEAGRLLAARIIEMWVETLVVRAWAGSEMELLAANIEQTTTLVGDVIDLAEARAWLNLRTGRADAAAAYFRSSLEDKYRSRLGLALALEAQGRREDAIPMYARVARDEPSTVQSAWARSRLLYMTGQDLARTDAADRVAQIAASVPPMIDRMLADPQEFMRLRISVDRNRLDPLGAQPVRLVLANRASIPLALGADRPIDARMLMSPEARVGPTSVIGGLQPEVFDIDHRLRLMPGEEITAEVWVDNGFTSALLETQAASRIAMRWRAIQGFRIVDHSYVRGPLCLSDTTPEIQREPLLLARLSLGDIAALVADAPSEQLPAVARAAWAASFSHSYGASPRPVLVAAVAEAFAVRYAGAGPGDRLLMLTSLPHGRLTDGFGAFDDAVRATIAGETDPAVLMAALLTRAQSADDPIIAACLAAPHPSIAMAAQIQADRLRDSRNPVFATAGPGVLGLAGPALPSLRGVRE